MSESPSEPRPEVVSAGTEHTERAPTPSNPGDQLPFPTWERYKLLAFLGAGGMGSVYKALDPRLGRLCAIKFLRGSHLDADHQRQRRRFEREARAQASLDHPHICKIFEVGEVEGQPYIAMELISGSSLSGLQRVLNLEEKLRIIAQVAEALHSAHSLGFIHRDIKPSNIMVERRSDGVYWPYLMDFGLARELDAQSSTTTGLVEGTPAYMSPEQALGSVRRLDHRSDVYSLGATLYLLLTGRMPFPGTSTEVIFEILTSDPVRPRKIDPSLHVDLETLVLKCMEKQPERRYDSAKALAEDLWRYLVGGRITARPPGLLQRLGKFVQRHKLLVASAGAALVVGLVLGGVALRTRWQAAAQARLAQELGQDIKEIELFMRAAYGLPLHDIAREQQVVRGRMQQLGSMLATADSSSAAALRYALGRGHLVLREYKEAQAALEQAFESGYKTSAARLALGLVLGERYRQELEQAQRLGDKKWVEVRERELFQRYLKPALSYLEGSTSSIDAPSYLPGLLYFYRGQYAEALSAAQRAQSEAPWLAEPLKLEGDVYQVMGVQMLDRGQYRDARTLLSRAAASHHAASAISSSDSSLYAAEAIDWIRVMEAEADTGDSIETAGKTAIEAADAAIVASPRSASGYQLKAWAYWRSSFVKMTRGQDGEPDVQRSVELARKAMQMNPTDWQSHYYLSLGVGTLAGMAMQAGRDESELNHQAILALRETIKLNKGFAWAWNDLGIQLYFTFERKLRHGEYDQILFNEAEQCYQESSRLDATYANPLMGRLELFASKIDFKIRHGESIDAEVALSLEMLKKSMSIKKDVDINYKIMSDIKMSEIEYKLIDGVVSEGLFSEALSALEKAKSLNPEVVFIIQDYIWYYLLRAKNDVIAGRDPQTALQQGLAVVAALEKRDAKSYDVAILKSRLYTLSGRTQSVAARADADLAQAVLAGRRAVELAANRPETHDVLCEALRYSVKARQTRGAPDQLETNRLSEQGLAECTAALTIEPNRATAHGHAGALWLQRAQRKLNPDATRTDATHAVQELTKALENNKRLQRDYGPLLSEAQTLSR